MRRENLKEKEKEREMDYLDEAKKSYNGSLVREFDDSNTDIATLNALQSIAAVLIAIAEKLPEKEQRK